MELFKINKKLALPLQGLEKERKRERERERERERGDSKRTIRIE